MGFLSQVVDGGRREVVAEAIEMGKVIASKSPIAIMGTKHLMNRESRGQRTVLTQLIVLDARDHS